MSSSGKKDIRQLDAFLRRPREYYNVDGVGEFGRGILCLGYTLLAFLQMHTNREAVWHQLPAVLLYVIALVAIVHHGSEAIKNRITYPRTGFVDYGSRLKRWPRILLVAACAAVIAAAIAAPGWKLALPYAIPGLAFALLYSITTARTVRWKWAIGCAMAAGAIMIGAAPAERLRWLAHQSSLPAIEPAMLGAIWLTMLVNGALLLLSGGLSFWLYLRDTHVQGTASE